MDKNRYEELVQLALKSELKPPRNLIEDYEKPMSKVMTARFLINMKKYNEALEILETIKPYDINDIEQWIWIVNDIGRCYFNGSKDMEKALSFFKRALALSQETDKRFNFIVRGELFYNVLTLLYITKKYKELHNAIRFITNYYNNLNNKFKYNSFLFYIE